MMFCIARCRRAGFTLIEILIVIAIIAILAGIAIPSFVGARAEAQLATCRENILAIANAFECYRFRHKPVEQYYSSCNWLVEEGYLEKLPTCPVGGYDNYWIDGSGEQGLSRNVVLGDVSSVKETRLYGWMIMCNNYHHMDGDGRYTSRSFAPAYSVDQGLWVEMCRLPNS